MEITFEGPFFGEKFSHAENAHQLESSDIINHFKISI